MTFIYWLFCFPRRVIIILDIEVLKPASDVPGKLGEPTPFVEGDACVL